MKEPRVLLLNASYEPLRIIPWQKAVCLWVDQKVEIVKSYADTILKSAKLALECPAVVRLLKYVKVRRDRIKFNRINVFSRDQFTCQYCGLQPGVRELTYDHVIPRSRGGKTVWENIVTCCLDCNANKADRTPEEASMPLRERPVKPTWSPFMKFRVPYQEVPDEWSDFLQQELTDEP